MKYSKHPIYSFVILEMNFMSLNLMFQMCRLIRTNLCPHLEVSGAEEVLSPPQRDHSSSYTLHRYGCVLAICYTDTTRTTLFGPLVLIQQLFTLGQKRLKDKEIISLFINNKIPEFQTLPFSSKPSFMLSRLLTSCSWIYSRVVRYIVYLFMLMDMNCEIFLRWHKFVSNVYKREVYFMSAAHVLSSQRKLRTW